MSVDEDILETLALHGVMTVGQIHRLHFANHAWATDPQESLARLHAAGYAMRCQQRCGRRRADLSAAFGARHGWRYALTAKGHRAAAVDRPHRVSPELLAGPHAQGVVAVNDFCLRLMAAAAAAGHRFEVGDWIHEVQHRFGPGAANVVKPDAVLTYRDHEGPLTRWVELDRGTYGVARLVDKLHAYAGYTDSGAWRDAYPRGLPRLVVVFDDHAPRVSRPRLRDFLDDAAADRVLRRCERLVWSAVMLSDFQLVGPWAPIFHAPAGDPADLLGMSGAGRQSMTA